MNTYARPKKLYTEKIVPNDGRIWVQIYQYKIT